ncbi:hypothetical protein QBC39DRAFT_59786 [Podospora conica]|nr:hypothetical protein QBC39DRAFT_59786 [Schizothecium conicum]
MIQRVFEFPAVSFALASACPSLAGSETGDGTMPGGWRVEGECVQGAGRRTGNHLEGLTRAVAAWEGVKSEVKEFSLYQERSAVQDACCRDLLADDLHHQLRRQDL